MVPKLKPLKFVGSSRDDLKSMPAGVRHAFGMELMLVQFGGMPSDFKPMPTVGAGTYEIRVRGRSGAYRTIFVAKFDNAVYLLHAFRKKSQRI